MWQHTARVGAHAVPVMTAPHWALPAVGRHQADRRPTATAASCCSGCPACPCCSRRPGGSARWRSSRSTRRWSASCCRARPAWSRCCWPPRSRCCWARRCSPTNWGTAWWRCGSACLCAGCGCSCSAGSPKWPAPRASRVHEGFVAAAGPAVSILLARRVRGAAHGRSRADAGLAAGARVHRREHRGRRVQPAARVAAGRRPDAARRRVGGHRAPRVRAPARRCSAAGSWPALLVFWALLGLVQGSQDRWLRLGVCAVTAWFVVVGRGRRAGLGARGAAGRPA